MKLVVAFWGANARRLSEFFDIISLGLDLDIPFYLVVCVAWHCVCICVFLWLQLVSSPICNVYRVCLHCYLVSREPLLYRVEISPGFFARAVAGCRRQRYLDVMAGLCKVE